MYCEDFLQDGDTETIYPGIFWITETVLYYPQN
jgi:hypothetical protein